MPRTRATRNEAAPLLIGVSARIHTPGAAGMPAQGVWSKTLHDLEPSVAGWLLGGGALPVMVPAVDANRVVQRSDIALHDYSAALDGLVLQGGNDVAPQSDGEEPLHPDWQATGRATACATAARSSSSAPSSPRASHCSASAAACNC